MIVTTYEQATGEHYSWRAESIEQAEREDELVFSYYDKKGVLKRAVLKKTAVTSITVDYSYDQK